MTLRNSLTSVKLFQNSCSDCSTYYYYLGTFFSHQTLHVEKGQTIIHKCCCVQLLSSRCSKPLSRKHHGKNFRLSLFFCLKITSSHHHLTYISSAISQLLRASNQFRCSAFFPPYNLGLFSDNFSICLILYHYYAFHVKCTQV